MIGREERSETDILVEDEETLKDLDVLLISHGPPDAIEELFVRERLNGLQPLIRQCWPIHTNQHLSLYRNKAVKTHIKSPPPSA